MEETKEEILSCKCVIRLVSIKTEGDTEDWGYDSHYYHDIVVKISDIYAGGEALVLDKISKGDYSLEGDIIWCSELESPLSKSNIMRIASTSDNLRQFSKDVMEDMYSALVGWCRSKWPSLNERGIYEIARAISEHMFGGEYTGSESSIYLIKD